MKRWIVICVAIVLIMVGALWGLSHWGGTQRITYGVTFTVLFAEELGLDWKVVYRAALDDLQVRAFRLVAHWPMVEPARDRYDFSHLDYLIDEAERRDARVILAVGRRLPRWPECHVPAWAEAMPWDEQKKEIRELIIAIVERYKDSPAITHWQVENGPYLSLFGYEACGALDKAFLHEEIELVRSLDSRPVLVTDSGNLGLWFQPYRAGDAFGTSLYMYFWTPEFGQFTTRLPAALYRLKANTMHALFGEKDVLLIELAAEPWLTTPTAETDIDTQLSRMDLEKFRNTIEYAHATRFGAQYLWGIEWWYYMKENGHPEFWSFAKTLYR